MNEAASLHPPMQPEWIERPHQVAELGDLTLESGAVIRDIVHRLSDRFPVRVVVWPVRVQGESSADEVTKAIRGFNALFDATGERVRKLPLKGNLAG